MKDLALSAYELDLEVQLYHLDECPVECEGMTQLISLFLDQEGVPHKKMIGCAQTINGNVAVFPHCWIELDNGIVIDFRLRMWLKDNLDIPHGIFRLEGSGIEYIGGPYDTPTISLELAQMMSDGKILDLL